ncbi:M15 family metallopeptidase [Leptotrichia hongkongensis]|uniref:M15 family metallopeptidase n=1 Tax=Leptotrichia hongkongensis TaxID=554406 RepID=A0ABV4S7C9_9FUSO
MIILKKLRNKTNYLAILAILICIATTISTANNIYENLYSFRSKRKVENPDPDFELKQKVKDRIKDVSTRAEAESRLVWVEVPVWRLKDGKKVSDTERFQILDVLANDVKEIFHEIHKGKEKFPIKNLIGYSWRGSFKSLHSTGRAIDLNPEENPQVNSNGKAIVGKSWQPGSNPYSIKPDGDVVRAFTKRGWIWGANFRTRDYMHFGFAEM